MLDVTLRDLREEDKAFFAKWAQDKEFYNLITINIPNPHYKMLIKVIEHKGKPIGEVDLVNVDLENKRAEFGIAVAPPYQNKGHGIVAASKMIALAFELGIHRIYGHVLAENENALRCALKMGFRIEGVQKDAIFRDGEYKDVVVISLLNEGD